MLWQIKKTNHEKAEYFAANLNLPFKFGEFLTARGFTELEEVNDFAKSTLNSIISPNSFIGMDIAIDRIIKAYKNNENILIWGDYDADGLTATALLKNCLKTMGHQVTAFIPDRLTNGYGLKKELVKEKCKKNISLIITVDCGVSDYEAIEEANSLGVDVIITDHHRLPPKLPNALAIINPFLNNINSIEPLAGVGVAFMLSIALKKAYLKNKLIEKEKIPEMVEALSLVAIGTVADLVPLTGTNRSLVKHGLNFLLNSKNCGLNALKKIAGLTNNQNYISTRDIGFKLAPKLNAAGRMGTTEPALKVLISNDINNANLFANQLEEINNIRYKEQKKLTAEALELVEEKISPENFSIILAAENWPKGLLGLAASKISEESQKPTILLSIEGASAIGSGRSCGNFNLYNALNSLRYLFTNFGGHAQAAGLTIPVENLENLINNFEKIAKNNLEEITAKTLEIDLELSLKDLDILAKPLKIMEPFGQGNPNPIVLIKNVNVLNVEPTKSNGHRHLRLTLSDGLTRKNIFAFNLAPRLFEFGPYIDAILSLEFTEWNKEPHASWQLIDFKAV